jgi:hypothetical protein
VHTQVLSTDRCRSEHIVLAVVYLFSKSPPALGSTVKRRGPRDIAGRLKGWLSMDMLNIHDVFVDAILFKVEDYE